MIIFDLDGTLADCEHRRHFIDPNSVNHLRDEDGYYNVLTGEKWKPDWQSFYDACDKDEPIIQVIDIWNLQISLGMMGIHQIWSGRSESVRKKTDQWLDKNLLCFESHQLKMRPIGNTEPDEVLKERWLDEVIAQGNTIDFVFDSHPGSIAMWRRRGIFVFNCCQHDNE